MNMVVQIAVTKVGWCSLQHQQSFTVDVAVLFCQSKHFFSLVRSLDILSTSADESVMEALKFVLDNQYKRAKYLPFEIDLDFISSNWRALVVEEVDGEHLTFANIGVSEGR